MPYELLWRNGDSEGWCDHLPDRFFMGAHRDAVHQHRCTRPKHAALVAECILNSDDRFLYIFYPEQGSDIYSGTTRIPVCDGEPVTDGEIGWADPGEQSFTWRRAEWGEAPVLTEATPDDEERFARSALGEFRIGQDDFRRGLDGTWGSACALTGVAQREALRASHIMPWRQGNGRLDPDNGLLLAAHVDALFDRYVITFDSSGHLHWSPAVSEQDRRALALPKQLRRMPTPGLVHYLEQHRAACGWYTA